MALGPLFILVDKCKSFGIAFIRNAFPDNGFKPTGFPIIAITGVDIATIYPLVSM